jgi:hypothetical protein
VAAAGIDPSIDGQSEIPEICTLYCAQYCGGGAPTPRDTVAHLATCPYYRPLEQTFCELWAALGWRGSPPPFAAVLVYGHMPRAADTATAQAIHGAILHSARWARNTITRARNGVHAPLHLKPMIASMKKWLVHHICLDHRAAVTKFDIGDITNTIGHAHRPASVDDFDARWGRLVTRTPTRLTFRRALENFTRAVTPATKGVASDDRTQGGTGDITLGPANNGEAARTPYSQPPLHNLLIDLCGV